MVKKNPKAVKKGHKIGFFYRFLAFFTAFGFFYRLAFLPFFMAFFTGKEKGPSDLLSPDSLRILPDLVTKITKSGHSTSA